MTLAADLARAADSVGFLPGQRVRTPKGIGRVLWVFPARKRPRMATVTVKFRRSPLGVPFYVREVRPA